MKRLVFVSLVLFYALASAAPAAAHCQIPCGIYDDELRVQLIEEHITTVEKSMKQIEALGKATPVDHNQLVRWINNKEEPTGHDSKEHTAYVSKLTLLHALQIHAMKAKQSTDLEQIEILRKLTAKFRIAYFGEEGKHAH